MIPGNFKSGKIAFMAHGNSKLGKVGPCENLEQLAKLPLNFQLVTQMVLAIITYTKWTLQLNKQTTPIPQAWSTYNPNNPLPLPAQHLAQSTSILNKTWVNAQVKPPKPPHHHFHLCYQYHLVFPLHLHTHSLIPSSHIPTSI